MTFRIALLPGDGVGSEVLAEAKKAIDALVEANALSQSLEWSELPGDRAITRLMVS